MTDPSQYFQGRTVQEQMKEVIGYVDTRAAEVATDAIASDVAQVHQDMLDADADASAAAASAAAAAGTLANAVKKTGEASQSIAGDIAVAGDLTGGSVTVPAPVNNTDAASKKYVDDADAVKLNITDIGSYAVLLTGNQAPIAGEKVYENVEAKILKCNYCSTRATTYDSTKQWIKVGSATIPNNVIRSQWFIFDDSERNGSSNQAVFSMFRVRFGKTSGGTAHLFVDEIVTGSGMQTNDPANARLAVVIESDSTFGIYWRQVSGSLDFCRINSIFSLDNYWTMVGSNSVADNAASPPADALKTVYIGVTP